MAANDIFNPNPRYDSNLKFNANPNYQSPWKPNAIYNTQRPRFGGWESRATGNGGEVCEMIFADRPIEQVRYIRKFWHQHQSGFFTYIDYDNGGRQHCGRFTSYDSDEHTANLKYTIRVTFEDVPNAPMIQYPSDWLHSSHFLYAVDDFLVPKVATSGTGWMFQQSPAAVAAAIPTTDPASMEAFEPAINISDAAVAAVGDWAQMEYVGFGWRMKLRASYQLGTVNILLDDVVVVTALNLATGVATSSTAQISLVAPIGPTVVRGVHGTNWTTDGLATVTMTNVPLGRHRVKIVCTVAGSLIYPALQVMH